MYPNLYGETISMLLGEPVYFQAVLWNRNYLFPRRLRLSKSFGSGSNAGSGNSFVTTCYHSFHIKKWIFDVFFMKEYQPNLHARSYILILIFYFSCLGAGAETSIFQLQSGSGQKFRLFATPAPQHCFQGEPQGSRVSLKGTRVSLNDSRLMISLHFSSVRSIYMAPRYVSSLHCARN
jgi:hypothetical protein